MTNRLRAIMRELNGERSLQAFLLADLVAALLALLPDELREEALDYIVQEARDRIPINEQLLEEARRQDLQ
jgi:hypothetical protein